MRENEEYEWNSMVAENEKEEEPSVLGFENLQEVEIEEIEAENE